MEGVTDSSNSNWIERIPGRLATTVALSALGIGGVSWAIMRYAPKLKELSLQHRATTAGGLSLATGLGTWLALRPLKVELVVGEEDWSEFPADGQIRLTQEHLNAVDFDVESAHPLAVWGTLRAHFGNRPPLDGRPRDMSNSKLVEIILQGAELSRVEHRWQRLLLDFNCIDATTIDAINGRPGTGTYCLIAALNGIAVPQGQIDHVAIIDLKALANIELPTLIERARHVTVEQWGYVDLPDTLEWLEQARDWNRFFRALGITELSAPYMNPEELQNLLASSDKLKELTQIRSISFGRAGSTGVTRWHQIEGTEFEWGLAGGPQGLRTFVNTQPQYALRHLANALNNKGEFELANLSLSIRQLNRSYQEHGPNFKEVLCRDLQNMWVEMRRIAPSPLDYARGKPEQLRRIFEALAQCDASEGTWVVKVDGVTVKIDFFHATGPGYQIEGLGRQKLDWEDPFVEWFEGFTEATGADFRKRFLEAMRRKNGNKR